jgi:hypothetical protein
MPLHGASADTVPADFVYRQGTSLMLNGAPYKYVGFNAFGMSGCEGTAWSRADLDAYFSQLPPNSMTRTWAFQGINGDDLSPLDDIVASAAAHSQKVIFSLSDNNSYCNELDGAGKANTEGSGKTLAWYQSGYKTKYIPWVQTVVARYKDSPAIGMWEIQNETGFVVKSGTLDQNTLKSFMDTAAATIKGIDANHLVESGTLSEDPEVTGEGINSLAYYTYVHSGPNIDVASFHEYEDPDVTVSGHFPALLNAAYSLNKPIIVGESGIDDCSVSDAARAGLFQQKFDGYLNGGAAGVSIWNRSLSFYGDCPGSYIVGPTDPTVTTVQNYAIPASAMTNPTAPAGSITAPAANATVSGTVAVTASASDARGVSKVQFQLDGKNLGTADTTSPYSTNWTTTSTTSGAHTLTAVVTNNTGLTATTAPVAVTVAASTVDKQAPTKPTGLQSYSTSRTSASFKWNASTDNVGVKGYRIYRDGVKIADQTGLTYTDTGRKANTEYLYGVEAYDAAGNVSARATVYITTNR